MISLESDYLNAYSKLKVECNENHNFDITLSNLNLDRWCPQCSTRKMEFNQKNGKIYKRVDSNDNK